MCGECGCEETIDEDDCGCGCGRHHHRHKHFRVRRFLTKEERVKMLEQYAEELEKELTAVRERIQEIRGK